jgi:protein TonB
MKMVKNSGLLIGVAVSLCLHGLFFFYINVKTVQEEEHTTKYRVTLSYAAPPPVSREKTGEQQKISFPEQPRKKGEEKLPDEQELMKPEAEIRVEEPEKAQPVPEETIEQKDELKETGLPEKQERAEERKSDMKSTAETIEQKKLPEEDSLAYAVTDEPEKIDEPISERESAQHGSPAETQKISAPEQRIFQQKEAHDLSGVIEALRERIVRRRVYPPVARKKGYEGTVTLMITLDARGNLSELVVSRSSGHKVLDRAAVALIKKVLPFTHNSGESVSVEIPITYELVE